LLVVISLGHVLLISAQVQSKSGLPLIEAVAFSVFGRFQATTAGVADAARSLWTNYFALSGASRENEALRRRILDLETQLQQQQALSARSRALEDALGLRQTLVASTLAARVIAGNPSPGALTVTIDRGTDDGVQPDLAVVAARGVVGRVIQPVAAHAATVQLLIDRHAAAAVTFERTRAGAMVVGGDGDPPLRAEYLSSLDEVQVGERVTTSGQDGIYPPGFLVGVVASVTRSNSRRLVSVRPAVDFSYIDIVLVVLDRPARAGSAPE
jgi:rod shape-determining protein MreC